MFINSKMPWRSLYVLGCVFIPFAFSWSLDCSQVPCSAFRCEPVTCDQGYALVDNLGGPCQCCSACAKVLKFGEPCDDEGPIIPDGQCERTLENIALCAKGLICGEDLTCNYEAKDPDDGVCNNRYGNKMSWSVDLSWLWLPQCDDLFNYKPVQHESSKYFCYSKAGRIFGKAYFMDKSAKDMNCACSLMEDYLHGISLSTGQFDHVVCQPNGNYLEFQCLRDLCFCVNETKLQVEGMILPKTLAHWLPCYNNDTYSEKYERSCHLQRLNEERLATYYYHKGLDIETMPLVKCDADGSYAAKYCTIESCSCVDAEGNRLGDATKMSTCHCLRDKWEMEKLGGTIMDLVCEAGGNYTATQCSGRKCFCVDEDGQQLTTDMTLEDALDKCYQIYAL